MSVGSLQRSRIKWQPLPRSDAAAAQPARRVRALDGPPVQDLPDLLDPEPRFMFDREALLAQLAFAFAGGDAADLIKRVLADVRTSASEWRPESFARHLYVDDFIRTACQVELDGRTIELDTATLGVLLTRPPSAPAVRDYRIQILAELAAHTEARAELTALYQKLRRMRDLFLTIAPTRRSETTRHRLELLEAIRAALEQGGAFGARTSGLSRVGRFAGAALASEAYARLRDLLEHDRRRANVSLDLRLGGDGRVRDVTIRSLVESTDNSFHVGPLRRWAMKVSLWLRGYRFSEEALIDQWIDGVYEMLEPWLPVLFQLLVQIELYLAALGFRDLARSKGLDVCLPELDVAPGERSQLIALFNPLLLAQGITPVPCDLVRSGAGSTTILTGPNSGGKTRLLQAVGLSQLLAQVGFFVPAKKARLRAVPLVFCSLVQEDSFDQTEGRLGTELLRIRRLFEEAKPGALVVLDELCSGTNPSEGEEIFMLVISLLHELQPETFVTSHFLDFVGRLAESGDPRITYMQVELDDKEQPTYAFVPGVAKTSLAARAAARLGVTREELSALVHKNRA